MNINQGNMQRALHQNINPIALPKVVIAEGIIGFQ
jgi:hypothetical protein